MLFIPSFLLQKYSPPIHRIVPKDIKKSRADKAEHAVLPEAMPVSRKSVEETSS